MSFSKLEAIDACINFEKITDKQTKVDIAFIYILLHLKNDDLELIYTMIVPLVKICKAAIENIPAAPSNL